MIQIDSSYDVILTYSPIIEITGHIFECFDYYLFLRQYCKVGILFFCGLNRNLLKIAFESKYTFKFEEIENDILHINTVSNTSNKQIIRFGKNTKVLLADGNIKSLEYNNIYLSTKYLYGFKCGNDNTTNAKINTHIIYLQDYRIYGKNLQFKSVNYVKKLPFKFYKKFNRQFDNIGMMYITYVCRKITPDIVKKYHDLSKCKKTIMIVPYKLPEYDTIDGVILTVAPVPDLFSLFDTYIYTPVNRKFDCSPRLITECFLHNKKVIKELDYYDIGLETRYNDCINNFQSLNLIKSDQILEILNLK